MWLSSVNSMKRNKQMASETMETAIMMEVTAIKGLLKKADKVVLPRRVREWLWLASVKCDNIQKTLEEGDPSG